MFLVILINPGFLNDFVPWDRTSGVVCLFTLSGHKLFWSPVWSMIYNDFSHCGMTILNFVTLWTKRNKRNTITCEMSNISKRGMSHQLEVRFPQGVALCYWPFWVNRSRGHAHEWDVLLQTLEHFGSKAGPFGLELFSFLDHFKSGFCFA